MQALAVVWWRWWWLACVLVSGGSVAETLPHGYGLLFRVSAAEVADSYVFATMHSDDERALALPDPVRQSLDRSSTFVMEVLPDANAMLTSMVTMLLTDGRGLDDLLMPELYARTVAAGKKRGLPESAMREFKPWAVVTLLSLPPKASKKILDLSLYQRAKAQGKVLQGLETIQEQLAIFDTLSERDQIRLLEDTLGVQQQLPQIFADLLDIYLSRDLAGLVEMSERYLSSGDPVLAQRFRQRAVDERNQIMVRRMRPFLQQGGAFIAIGALHLPGRQGVLSLLEDNDFSVQRVY
jgi:uncharacterized protein YbaP (TraB family)